MSILRVCSWESKDVEVISVTYKQVGELEPGQSIPITFLIRAPTNDGIYFPEDMD